MDTVSRNRLSLYLVFSVSLWLSKTRVGVQGASTDEMNCSFPNFLQELCSEPSKTCRHWSQGRRLAHEGKNAFYGYKSDSIGERKWVFKGGEVEIFATEVGEPQPSRIKLLKFYCWQKIAPHIFIISSKNTSNKSDSNAKYSCIKFRKRGRNVIEYEQSSWRDNYTSLACNESDLVVDENPLILNALQELPDCPTELNGGFQIRQLYNGKTDKECFYDNETDSVIFESDCLGKEGLTIQLPANRDCSLRGDNSATGPFHVGFYCYSAAWKDKQFTYFIVKRQSVKRNVFLDSTVSDFRCARFKKSGDEIQLQLYSQPICWRNVSTSSSSLILHLRRRTSIDKPLRFPSETNKTQCSFPEKFQGTWREISPNYGLQTVVIKENTVDISPYGLFHCKLQHIFQHQAPHKCSSLVTGKWPGTGQAKFFIDDYLLISNFSNGCRARVTRFGVTDVIGRDILLYRLSQSVPFVNERENAEEYFSYHVLKQFCSSWLPYITDPHPIWGRNIEKIAMKLPVIPVHSIELCSFPTLGKGIYHFKSVYSDQSECVGPASRIEFGCDNPLTFEVKYDPSCQLPDVSFDCIGKAWRIGHFSLVQDIKGKNISCMWFDKENDQLFRLRSPQCSDTSWGKRPGEERNYAEKFVFQYYSKCPIISNTKNYDYPKMRGKRNASLNFHTVPGFIIFTCLLTLNIFCTSVIGM